MESSYMIIVCERFYNILGGLALSDFKFLNYSRTLFTVAKTFEIEYGFLSKTVKLRVHEADLHAFNVFSKYSFATSEHSDWESRIMQQYFAA